MSSNDPLLEVDDLTIQYTTGAGELTAVSDASFVIDDGEYFGLVGESGCGKSTIAKSIIGGLDENGRIASGEIWFKGHPLHDMTQKELNQMIRWKEISLIPQSSMNSLDPLRRISTQAIELAEVHTNLSESEALDRIRSLFQTVGLQENRIREYPHQFSGGMQQRAIIALSLFLDPSLIIADEPTTALDVIMQDQVFQYLDMIQEERNTSMLLITHDISLVFESCQSMAVMHAGQVAETGPVEDLFQDPRHPYNILLQNAFPDIRYPDRDLEVIEGAPPQEYGEIDFCTFVDRCPWAIDECTASAPPLALVDDSARHRASCIRMDETPELSTAPTPEGGE